MPDLAVQPLGALFGPNNLTIKLNDQTGGTHTLEIFPDAANPALRANGLPMQFYYMPQELYLAKKEDSPADFDFSVTLFKGLMTTEDTLGLGGIPTTGGEVDAGGAFVTFSMTMAVPDSVLAQALALLKSGQHDAPAASIADYFTRGSNDPDPKLGIVTIVDNAVTIEVPQLAGAPSAAPATAPAASPTAGTQGAAATSPPPSTASSPATGAAASPWFINAQGSGHGSIEASGKTSFLVTCGQMAAGAIVGALQNGNSPFTVHYNLTLMFYINAVNILMTVNASKVFTQVSGAVEAKYPGGFAQADLSANYQSCVESGAITTVINDNAGLAVDPDLKKMIDQECGDMQTHAWDLVKDMFNWKPTPDAPATASTGACGGAAITLKVNYQAQAGNLTDSYTLNESVTKLSTASGTLADLEPAIKANLNKYLAIVDIGEYFQKIQVAATANINFSDPNLADPISAALVEVSYPVAGPDGKVPLLADGTPTLKTLGNGFHYTPGVYNQAAPSALARWTKDNPNDIINISFMRLLKDLKNWSADQVTIKKTLVYNSDDPRVDLSTGTPEVSVVTTGIDHTPVIDPGAIGYIYVQFVLDRPIASNVTVTLTIQMGGRTDVLTMTSTNPTQKPVVLWQVWSDKYFSAAVAKVQIDVEVAPPPSNFSGAPVTWSGNQAIPIGVGRIKRIVPCIIQLPVLTDPAQATLAGQYILQTQKEAAGIA